MTASISVYSLIFGYTQEGYSIANVSAMKIDSVPHDQAFAFIPCQIIKITTWMEIITLQVQICDSDDRFAGGQPCFEASASPARSRES